MSPLALLIAVALASADRVLMGFKWRQLVRAAGGSLRLSDATNIYYQTCFTDLVFPNVVASEGLSASTSAAGSGFRWRYCSARWPSSV